MRKHEKEEEEGMEELPVVREGEGFLVRKVTTLTV
jgi:hypothetical protein